MIKTVLSLLSPFLCGYLMMPTSDGTKKISTPKNIPAMGIMTTVKENGKLKVWISECDQGRIKNPQYFTFKYNGVNIKPIVVEGVGYLKSGFWIIEPIKGKEKETISIKSGNAKSQSERCIVKDLIELIINGQLVSDINEPFLSEEEETKRKDKIITEHRKHLENRPKASQRLEEFRINFYNNDIVLEYFENRQNRKKIVANIDARMNTYFGIIQAAKPNNEISQEWYNRILDASSQVLNFVSNFEKAKFEDNTHSDNQRQNIYGNLVNFTRMLVSITETHFVDIAAMRSANADISQANKIAKAFSDVETNCQILKMSLSDSCNNNINCNHNQGLIDNLLATIRVHLVKLVKLRKTMVAVLRSAEPVDLILDAYLSIALEYVYIFDDTQEEKDKTGDQKESEAKIIRDNNFKCISRKLRDICSNNAPDSDFTVEKFNVFITEAFNQVKEFYTDHQKNDNAATKFLPLKPQFTLLEGWKLKFLVKFDQVVYPDYSDFLYNAVEMFERAQNRRKSEGNYSESHGSVYTFFTKMVNSYQTMKINTTKTFSSSISALGELLDQLKAQVSSLHKECELIRKNQKTLVTLTTDEKENEFEKINDTTRKIKITVYKLISYFSNIFTIKNGAAEYILLIAILDIAILAENFNKCIRHSLQI